MITKTKTKKTISRREPQKEFDFDVYYIVEPTFETNECLKKYWVLRQVGFRKLRSMKAVDQDDVYTQMQGEFWSPNGEARPLIKKLGLGHTSMSIGDCAYNVDTDTMYQCGEYGWKVAK